MEFLIIFVTAALVLCLFYIINKVFVGKKKRLLEDKLLWFLRWTEPRSETLRYVKDISAYERDKNCWIRYQELRRYYIQKLIEMQSETGADYISALKYHYLEDYAGPYSTIFEEMDKMGVTLSYVPGKDYIAIDGPLWADNPKLRDSMPAYDRIYIISHENIDRLVMDHMKYYNIDKMIEDSKRRQS